MTTWVDALEAGAPDIVAAWRGIEEGRQDDGPTGSPEAGRGRARRNGSSRNSRPWRAP